MTVAKLVAVALCLSIATARAQSPEAEVLFREGRQLIKQGKIADGCDKLAASEQLESSVGTLLNLGDCHEKLGRFASAWAAFRKAEALAKRSGRDDKRQAEATRRAAALENSLSTLVVEVTQPVVGIVVRRDDEVVPHAAWSIGVPVDPDRYTIVAEAPGFKTWRTEVTIQPKLRRKVVTIPRLEPAAVEPRKDRTEPLTTLKPVPSEPPAVTPQLDPPATVTTRRDGTWTGPRKVSATLAIAGAGALGTGLYFGIRANDLQDRSDARCPLSICADPEGLRYNREAKDAARTANILYVSGGAALAVATVLWFVGSPGEHTVVTPVVGDHHAGATLSGRF